MWFLGDVHGAFTTYKWALQKMPLKGNRVGMDCSLQLGDMGVFREVDIETLKFLKPTDKFIAGNHDCPELCLRIPNCLGYGGYIPELEMFYIGGGYSIDVASRTPGVTWWEGEENSYNELARLIGMYADLKPKIIVSHECPSVIKSHAIGLGHPKWNMHSRTEDAMEQMFNAWQPEEWIHGHYHVRYEHQINKTHFVGLDEFLYGATGRCCYEIPGLKWPELKPTKN